MRKLRVFKVDYGHIYSFHCPACGYEHPYHVRTDGLRPEGNWGFNGNLERPTFTPSLRVFGHGEHPECHVFVTDGRIHYQSDCGHAMARLTVELPDLDD